MKIEYRFVFANGQEEHFAVRLDPETLAYLPDASAEPPAWTRLENQKCRICPLKEADSPHCPVAVNLEPVLSKFVDHLSYENVDVVVGTEAREYRKKISLQKGISAIFGLIMATSGCPVLDKLRPMVLTHLPLADIEETRYRAISMYLFAQFFRERKGLPPDWNLKGLGKIYADIGALNRDFIRRLHTIEMKDANFNALVGLDCFCLSSEGVMTRSLDKLERLFQSYL
jgi:uncharacterized protein DUF6901